MEEKATYQKKVEEKLKRFSETIGELTGKTEKLQEDAKAECHKQIEALRAKQGTAREKLRELEEAGDEAWEDLKEGVENAWKDLKNALESAISRFKSNSDRQKEEKSNE